MFSPTFEPWIEYWLNVCKPENSSYETRNFSSSISSNMQKKCWMKCCSGHNALQNPLFTGQNEFVLKISENIQKGCYFTEFKFLFSLKDCYISYKMLIDFQFFLRHLLKQILYTEAKQAFLKNFQIFLGKHLFWSLYLIKLQAYI